MQEQAQGPSTSLGMTVLSFALGTDLVCAYYLGGGCFDLLAGEGFPAAARQVPEDEVACNASYREQQDSLSPLLKHKLADSEEAAINQDYSHQPVECVAGDVFNFGQFRRQFCDGTPAVNRRMHAPVKRNQSRV